MRHSWRLINYIIIHVPVLVFIFTGFVNILCFCDRTLNPPGINYFVKLRPNHRQSHVVRLDPIPSLNPTHQTAGI